MATFLTTSKMNPALATRVENAVRGRRVRTGATSVDRSHWVNAAGRLAVVSLLLLMLGSVGVSWLREREALAHARAELLAEVDRSAAELTQQQRELPARLQALLTQASADHDDVAQAGVLQQLTSRPVIYLRADRGALVDEHRLPLAAQASAKDSFLMCLYDPPGDDSEKALLQKVRLTHAGAVGMRTKNVRRVYSALAALRLLSPPWRERIEQASSADELAKLRSSFESAPVEAGIEAAKAELLVYLIDDPHEPGTPVELDGASRHRVRVGVVEIASGKALLRRTTTVDPAWISEASRFELGRSLNACRLAFDVRARAKE